MSTFSMRAVLGRTFSVIVQSLSSVGALIISVQVVMAAMQFSAFGPMLERITTKAASPLAMFTSGSYWAMVIVSIGLFSILFAGATHGYLAAAEGRRADLAECTREGLSKALPVLGLMVLWGLGVWLGMILLLVPGLILITMWSVSMPALVSGEASVMGSFGRSRQLTKGSRWKIFALLLLFGLVYYALYISVLGSTMSSVAPGDVTAAMAAGRTSAVMAGSLIVSTIMLFILPAMLASIYVELTHGRVSSGDVVSEVFA